MQTRRNTNVLSQRDAFPKDTFGYTRIQDFHLGDDDGLSRIDSWTLSLTLDHTAGADF